MKKYLLKRILFSIFALFVVTGAVMILVYTLLNENMVLANDDVYKKAQGNEKTVYRYRRFKEFGYIDYVNFGDWMVANKEQGTEAYTAAISSIQEADKSLTFPTPDYCQEFVTTFQKSGYTVEWLQPVTNSRGVVTQKGYLVASRKINVFSRLLNSFGNMFSIDTIWSVDDPNLPMSERYVRWEWDKYSNMPALVGNGTRNRYLIYFDDQFPFVHQNIFHINLGKSIDYSDRDTVDVIMSRTGNAIISDQVLPKDLDKDNPTKAQSNLDFHTVTYSASITATNAETYGEGNHYINATRKLDGFTRIGNSFVIGIIATVIAYIIGMPLGIWMARKKDKLPDKIGTIYIVFIIAVPSLAYIFMFAALGVNLFGLPYKWALATLPALAFILPTISLALPSIGGLMRWIRRYMIDQENADYVKFARSQGLTEREIFVKHIFRNAMIFIVHSIPIDILGCLVGAIITERIYGVPGIGGLLTNAINSYDNGVIIASTVFYTAISIIALLLGDLLLAKYDPRVSFTNERG